MSKLTVSTYSVPVVRSFAPRRNCILSYMSPAFRCTSFLRRRDMGLNDLDGKNVRRASEATKMGGKSDIPHLKKRLQEENSELAKIGFYQSLYTLGEHQVLAELLW